MQVSAQTHTHIHTHTHILTCELACTQDSFCAASIQVSCQDTGGLLNGEATCEQYQCVASGRDLEVATFNPSRPLIFGERTTATCKTGYQIGPVNQQLATCSSLVGSYPAVCKDCSLFNESVKCLPVACDVDSLRSSMARTKSGTVVENIVGSIGYQQTVQVRC
jgi:hypothetical protein